MPVTERIILSVTGGVDNWKDALKFMLQTLKKQDGYIRTRWGPWSENENNLELLIGWESIDAQAKFQSSADFTEAMNQMKPVLSGKPTKYFMQLFPYAPKEIIDSAIVQVVTITGSTGSIDSFRPAVEKNKSVEGCTGVASGAALGEVDGKGVPFVAVCGWESLEASRKGSVKDMGIDGDVEVHHVNFRYPIKGFRGL